MNTPLPNTADEAVDQIIEEMSFDDVVKVSKLSELQLAPIKLVLRAYVRTVLKHLVLIAYCCKVAGIELDEAGASTAIIDELWKKLNGL